MNRHFSPSLAKLRTLQTNAVNLTTLINMAVSGEQTDAILNGIIPACEHQFNLEEKTMTELKATITQEHLDEHKRLLKEFRQQKGEWKAQQITALTFAESLKAKFYFHSSVYDQPLRESLLTPK